MMAPAAPHACPCPEPQNLWMFHYDPEWDDWYCDACNSWATEGRLKSAKHRGRAVDRWTYNSITAARVQAVQARPTGAPAPPVPAGPPAQLPAPAFIPVPAGPPAQQPAPAFREPPPAPRELPPAAPAAPSAAGAASSAPVTTAPAQERQSATSWMGPWAEPPGLQLQHPMPTVTAVSASTQPNVTATWNTTCTCAARIDQLEGVVRMLAQRLEEVERQLE